MSRLSDLIAVLCPDGVEIVPLYKVSKIERGQRVTKSKLSPTAKYPVISGGINPMGFLDYYNRDENTITVAQYGTAGFVNFQKQKFWANDVCYTIQVSPRLLNKYLYYFLRSKQDLIYSMKIDAVPAHLPLQRLESLSISIPPLEVQKEIVRILDQYSAAEQELETQLDAELEARGKQYTYYRDALLDFSPGKPRIGSKHSRLNKLIETLCPDGVEYAPLGKVLINNNALYCVPRNEYKEVGKLPIIDQSKAYIAAYTNNESAIPPVIPCIIFGDHTRIVKYADQKFAQGYSGTKVFIPLSEDINTKYIFYVFSNINIPSRGYNRHWSIVQNIEVPVPPLPVQKEIVRILDQFDTLVNDIKQGLPAEKAARRKQYEYYRDKLLTFKEKQA